MDDSSEGESLDLSRLVRPYMVTGGRSTASTLPIETMVKSLDADQSSLADEALGVCVAATDQALAIAELSAILSLPVGVTRVVVSDLIDSGHLESYETAGADDVAVVTRILNALSPAGGAK